MLLQKSKKDELAAHVAEQRARFRASIDDIKKQIANHDEIKAQLKELRDREDAIQKLQAARTGPTVGAPRALAHPDARPHARPSTATSSSS